MNWINSGIGERMMIISLGAVLGANARYLLSNWAAQKFGVAFPHGTFLINLSGSLLIGFFLALTAERVPVDPRWRLFFAVGFLGAYTTFSTYTYDSLTMLERGQWLLGLFNLFGSTLLGLAAVALGCFLGKNLF